MKTIMIAMTALTLATGAAGAATSARNERPDAINTTAAVETMQVRANSVMTSAELARADMDAGEMLTVTAFPSTTQVANSNQDR